MLNSSNAKSRRRTISKSDPIDEYLDVKGLCRKQVARDGCSLFRAAAEQVSAYIML